MKTNSTSDTVSKANSRSNDPANGRGVAGVPVSSLHNTLWYVY